MGLVNFPVELQFQFEQFSTTYPGFSSVIGKVTN